MKYVNWTNFQNDEGNLCITHTICIHTKKKLYITRKIKEFRQRYYIDEQTEFGIILESFLM